MQKRDYVIPEDVQTVLPGIIGHRLAALAEHQSAPALIDQLLKEVPIP